jgi:hypothetical protein
MVSNRRRWSGTLRGGAVALCVLAGSAAAHGGTAFTPIAFTGDPTGIVGVSFESFGMSQNTGPVIASNGDVSFLGSFSGEGITTANDVAIFVRRAGANAIKVQKGQTIGGMTAFDFDGHNLSSTAWAAVVSSIGADDTLVAQGSGGINILLQASAGWNGHDVDSLEVPAVNDLGQIATSVLTTDGGLQRRIGRAAGPEGPLVELAAGGDAVVGLAGAQVTSFSSRPVGMNDFGRIATLALLENQSGQTVITTSVNDQGVVTIDDSGVSLVSQTGTRAPNFITGIDLVDFGYDTFAGQPVDVGNSGGVVFSGMVNGLGITENDNTAIFRSAGGTASRVVRESSPAPGIGVGVTFTGFPTAVHGAPFLTNANQIFFMPGLGGTGSGNAVFFGGASGLSPILYSGLPAGVGSDIVIDEILNFDANNNNQALILVRVSGTGVNTSNDEVLYSFNGSSLNIELREGDNFFVGGADRAIADMWISDGATPDTMLNNFRRVINDAGEGVIAITFGDGTAGVFTFDLPAPCAIPVTIPSSLRAIEGTRTRFQGSATGADSVQWLANGANISDGDTYTGATTALLSITRASGSLDGTSYTLAASNACGTIAPDPLVLTVGKRFDMDKDGRNEILWRNGASGANLAWNVAADGQSISNSYALPSVSDINWKLVATADFNADGNLDLVWRNSVTGDNAVWFMNGGAFVSASDLPRVADASWEIRSVADFDNDGIMDLLWRNRDTGANVVWLMNLTFGTINSSVSLSTVSETYWQIAGTGDFNADGNVDIVWRNARTGAHAVWYMTGTTFSGAADISPAASDVNVRIAAVADYNNDAKPDLLMRNTLTGANELWIMDGVTRSSVVTLPSVADTFWRTMGQPRFKAGQDSDFNGDGKADLFFRHATNGQNAVWLLNGPTFSSIANLTPITDNNWVVEAVADLNRDNKTDIFWRNRSTGQNVLWIMNGTTVTQSIDMPGVSNLAWHVGAVADVDGDEIADLIWNNRDTGDNLAWILDGTPTDSTVVRRVTPLSSQTSPSWGLKGAGDFNRDDKFDLVFRFDGVNPDTGFVAGDNEYWRLSGTTLASRLAFPNVASLSWDIRAVNDYNQDGYPDLLWRNSSTGANTIWLMRDRALGNSIALPTVSDTGWQIFR